MRRQTRIAVCQAREENPTACRVECKQASEPVAQSGGACPGTNRPANPRLYVFTRFARHVRMSLRVCVLFPAA